MTVNVSWDDDDETIARMDFIGEWTWDEVHQAARQMRAMVDEIDYDFNFIIDVSQGIGAPSPFLSQLRTVARNGHPRQGMTVLVGLSDAIQIFWKIFVQLYARIIREDRFAYANTVEEARVRIAAKAALQAERTA
jgi:hypothetical protein